MINLTVGVPIHPKDNPNFVGECLDSLIVGNRNNYRLIFVLDGESDVMIELIHSKKFNDYKIIVNKENIGLSCVLNQMIEACQTKYFRRMDSDDILLLEGLKFQYLEMVNRDLDICGTHAYLLIDGVITKRCYNKPLFKSWPNLTLIKTPFIHPTVMFNVETLRDFDLKYSCSNKSVKDLLIEDWLLWNECRIAGIKVSNIDTYSLVYRIKDVKRQIYRFKAAIPIKSKALAGLELNRRDRFLKVVLYSFLRIAYPLIIPIYRLKFD